MRNQNVSLSDRYDLTKSRVLLNSSQALVRLLLAQSRLDYENGLSTAGFVTGYRGSPLGGFDSELWRAESLILKNRIHFQPGLNEDLAATSCWGTQQLSQFPDSTVDGVFAMWYGKGPGVDRSGDPLKHGNRQGTAPNGGVLAVFGDDHAGKSSTVSHQSELAMIANGIPVLYPASVGEIIEFGLLGWAMSRFSGTWVSMKLINETAESTAVVNTAWPPIQINRDQERPSAAVKVHASFGFSPIDDEMVLERYRLPAVQEFAQAHALNRFCILPTGRNLGIVTSGKSWLDTLAALAHLNIDEQRAGELGLNVFKAGMIWPLERESTLTFCSGHREIFVVEEKRAVLEPQITEILYNLPQSRRPAVVGKRDEKGNLIFPSDIQLGPMQIAVGIGVRLEALGICTPDVKSKLAGIRKKLSDARTARKTSLNRLPYFCSGCPHNTSTKVPDDSIAMSGIGCHTMAIWMDRNTTLPTQMGGEGANWIGAAPFVGTNHVFQNLGDGTYAHSGLLAIRAALAVKVNITYKILYNDAVAMTGGQPVEGQFSVYDIARQVRAEGVRHIVLMSDNPDKFQSRKLPPGTSIRSRNHLDAVQRELRELPGVSVLIYEQICAAEKRRRRKRGLMRTPDRTIHINPRVCDGCGDCSQESNCVSVLPLETGFGRKRKIDQSNCNKDFSCVEGFCPSFVSVRGVTKQATQAIRTSTIPNAVIPDPGPPEAGQSYNIVVAGIGGTGVVTVAALLAMAARIEGKGATVFDMTGLAQKGGAVLSHLRLLESPAFQPTPRIGISESDLVLGCDLVVANGEEALGTVDTQRTHAVVNSHLVPTADFQSNPQLSLDPGPLLQSLADSLDPTKFNAINANEIAEKYLGNSIGVNLFMVGYAWQLGLIPLSLDAIQQAIEINNVAVEFNKNALRLGRMAAHDPALLAEVGTEACHSQKNSDIEEFIQSRMDHLEAYQDTAYAHRFRTLVDATRYVEAKLHPGQTKLTHAVANAFSHLLAYKDEYEISRLHSDGQFMSELKKRYGENFKLSYHLSPPILAHREPVTGVPYKMEFGNWILPVFKVLAHLKFLRGGPFDIFGYTAERRMERSLIEEFEKRTHILLSDLQKANYECAIAIIESYLAIKGFGHVKVRSIKETRLLQAELLDKFKAFGSDKTNQD